MTLIPQVQINIVLSILLAILIGHGFFNMNRRKVTNRLFLWVMGLTWLTLMLEIFSVILNNPSLKQFMVIHKLVDTSGFIVAPIIPFLGCIFIQEWINRYQKNKIEVNTIMVLPLLVNGMGALLSFSGFGLFHITSENIYERGSLFFIAPLIGFTYFGYGMYFIYKQRKKLSHSELAIFSLSYIAPAVFTGVQLKYSAYLTTWNSAAIIMVVAYIFILNDQGYRDSLTGLGSRLSYEHYAQTRDWKKLNKLVVVYIDIDEFKAINDEYGHHEGDEAIKAFANLLVESFPFKHQKLIRLGGDEFLVLLEEQRRENVAACIRHLAQHVEAYNNEGEKPYRLSFSYGVAYYTNAYESVQQLLEYADDQMYEQKQSKRGSLA